MKGAQILYKGIRYTGAERELVLTHITNEDFTILGGTEILQSKRTCGSSSMAAHELSPGKVHQLKIRQT